MSTKKHSHWDMRGNPIVDFYEMRKRYASCAHSTKVLLCCLPHQYVVVPDVYITINSDNPKEAKVNTVYPGGENGRIVELSDNAIASLRKLYKNLRSNWKVQTRGKVTTFSRVGGVKRPNYSMFSR